MSSHRLGIETGRYSDNFQKRLDREERTCIVCPLHIEDEKHVLFECPIYVTARIRHLDLMAKYPTVKEILNPLCVEDAELLGTLLLQIENIRKSENLQ